MFTVVLNNAQICWLFFYPPLSRVRSNLCNIWRYPVWSATYLIYGGIYTGNLRLAQQATCLKSKQQIVHRSFFWNINFCTSDLHFFVFSVNLIQHASCNFPIFFSYATIHKVLLKVYLSIYIASLKYTKASTIHYYITTHNALIKS